VRQIHIVGIALHLILNSGI